MKNAENKSEPPQKQEMRNSVVRKVIIGFLIAVGVYLIGTFAFDLFSNKSTAVSPLVCLGEGVIAENGSLGPNGHFGKCCPGMEPRVKPGEENIDGNGLYCTKI